MRAALLPAGADPFLLTYWLRHYRTWYSEVDELRVQVSGLMGNTEIRDYLTEYVRDFPNVILTFVDERVDHGEVIARLVSETSADLVMLCEDDAFVRKPAVVTRAFARIEQDQTDIVASPRATATPEVLRAVSERYGWVVSPSGEAGPLMWPCFLFARKADLLRTDGNFSVKNWHAGDVVAGQTVTEDNSADTFGDASIQLMALGLRVHWDSQYRVDEELLDTWHGAPWFHVGSLSASTDYLIHRRPPDRAAWIEDMRVHGDWVKRISWWLRTLDAAEGMKDLASSVRSDLMAVVGEAGIGQDRIDRWTRRLDPFVTWA